MESKFTKSSGCDGGQGLRKFNRVQRGSGACSINDSCRVDKGQAAQKSFRSIKYRVVSRRLIQDESNRVQGNLAPSKYPYIVDLAEKVDRQL
jgi:hypothetical protein